MTCRQLINAARRSLALDKPGGGWSNANRIQQEHDLDVAAIERDGFVHVACGPGPGVFFRMEGNPGVIEAPGHGIAFHANPPLGEPVGPDLIWPSRLLRQELRHREEWRHGAQFVTVDRVLKPSELDLLQKMVVDGQTPAEAMAFIRGLSTPQPWRWWADPVVIGFAVGFLVIGGVVAWLAGS